MKINTISELENATPSVLDGRFSMMDVKYEPSKRSFSIKCWTPPPKQGRREARMWEAHLLHFADVISCKIEITEKVAYYELSRIKYVPGQNEVEFQTHYAATITLSIERLAAEFVDLKETRHDWK